MYTQLEQEHEGMESSEDDFLIKMPINRAINMAKGEVKKAKKEKKCLEAPGATGITEHAHCQLRSHQTQCGDA